MDIGMDIMVVAIIPDTVAVIILIMVIVTRFSMGQEVVAVETLVDESAARMFRVQEEGLLAARLVTGGQMQPSLQQIPEEQKPVLPEVQMQ